MILQLMLLILQVIMGVISTCLLILLLLPYINILKKIRLWHVIGALLIYIMLVLGMGLVPYN